ncbi:3-isopropylmalate dehydratase small subunit [Sulfitobacter sabulilitoris]|uniref:3-isopropylmalate dehydratase n=1 Tax=Sulfitobacter sabulilitoris TaxID=2562655 RepID=A0A5S3PDF7_9RHOB|nr:3-isopropylmalate dehydratase small subunit [Sulfitobacter sabulilitoris]TMM51808.1 3-isopropylmalate dehydratase small subunit [Sulfitobacter sabulilitoris]
MSGWTTHTGQAAVLGAANIDTDQLIPARFMSASRAEGYGDYLLHDVRDRYDLKDGDTIIVAGRNFGSGSSREAAVYALADFGIRAVIAPSFGDIFASNAVNNGLLPARVDASDLGRLTGTITVDLDSATLTCGDARIPFELDPIWRLKLIKGWDDIDLTAQHEDDIASFARARRAARPWAWPADKGT